MLQARYGLPFANTEGMKFFILSFAALALISPLTQAAPTKPVKTSELKVPAIERIPEARCYDIKQSVLADLPGFCGNEKTDKVRLIDFGSQLELLEKKCGQPELAYLLKKALNDRVYKKSKKDCALAAEKMLQPSQNKAQASSQDLGL